MNGWKPLASVTLIAALVMAPMVSMGAYADEVVPPDESAQVIPGESAGDELTTGEDADASSEEAVPAPQQEVVNPEGEPAVAEEVSEAPQAEEPAAPTVDDSTPAEESVPAEASVPAGASKKQEVATTAPAGKATAAVAAQEDVKWVFVCKYVGKPGENEVLQPSENNPIAVSVNSIPDFEGIGSYFADAQGRSYVLAEDPSRGGGQSNEPSADDCPPGDVPEVVTPTLTVIPPTCEDEGSVVVGPADGVTWTQEAQEDGTTIWTAMPESEEFVFPESAQTEWIVPDLSQLEGEQCEGLQPPTVVIDVDCELDSEVVVTANNPNSVPVQVTLYLDFNLDGTPDASEVLTMQPGESVLSYNFAEDLAVGVRVMFGETTVFSGIVEVNCEPDVYPVPEQFSAAPAPATCVSPGTFSTAFLGTPMSVEGAISVYDFENVIVTVDRSEAGEVMLTVEAKEGFTLTGLSSPPWMVNADATVATRTIELEAQLSGPQVCPLVVLPAPAAPTFTDLCGTANDGYTVPGNTADYTYEVTENGDTVSIEVVLVDEEDTFPEGTVTEWSFTFTDVACPAPAGGSAPPPPAPGALPATGGVDMTPWGIGAALMLLAGTALLTTRRLARR